MAAGSGKRVANRLPGGRVQNKARELHVVRRQE